MKVILLVLTLFLGITPFIWPSRYWIRLSSTIILLCIAFLHAGFLLTAHRLVAERLFLLSSVTDAKNTSKVVQDLFHSNIAPFCLLIVAFTMLALLPYKKLKEDNK
jgi:hypothetical protein